MDSPSAPRNRGRSDFFSEALLPPPLLISTLNPLLLAEEENTTGDTGCPLFLLPKRNYIRINNKNSFSSSTTQKIRSGRKFLPQCILKYTTPPIQPPLQKGSAHHLRVYYTLLSDHFS
jgi:hypothetical protein